MLNEFLWEPTGVCTGHHGTSGQWLWQVMANEKWEKKPRLIGYSMQACGWKGHRKKIIHVMREKYTIMEQNRGKLAWNMLWSEQENPRENCHKIIERNEKEPFRLFYEKMYRNNKDCLQNFLWEKQWNTNSCNFIFWGWGWGWEVVVMANICWPNQWLFIHYGDVIMGMIASQITSLTIVYSTVYSDTDQRKHQSSASLAFVRGIHRGPVNSPHKWPVTRKMCPFDDVIMC